ncbi:PLD nuclease N-terminal domain-containing protein [Nocardioides marmoribigeumensis]|uniref:Cardiolipin synthase N-terminal domain-containing protein n=1 Tax=Nocardioides marmoribigeumensis TaxID=433649 RepID=A0ABU2BZI5_9ACTN|nr:PLD nuclease N-terminal domain-containing protein [Nocardioides marmoribigeumensis]MDR7363794.1 hypothetical protein [Nocardioides marmoribigeumensis]
MIKLELAFGLLVLALWVFSVIDVITSDEGAIRYLPKVPWLLLVLFFPLAGSVAWLVAGRPAGPPTPRPYERAAPAYPEYDRPGRAAAGSPGEDEAFLARVRERAEEQRRAYEQRRRPEEAGGAEGAGGPGGA